MLIKLIGSTKIIIFLLLLSSCGSIKVNGVEVRGRERKLIQRQDLKWLGLAAITGYAVGYQYKEELKGIRK